MTALVAAGVVVAAEVVATAVVALVTVEDPDGPGAGVLCTVAGGFGVGFAFALPWECK